MASNNRNDRRHESYGVVVPKNDTYLRPGWIWHKYVFVNEDSNPFVEHRRFVSVAPTKDRNGIWLRNLDMPETKDRFRSLLPGASLWCFPTDKLARDHFTAMTARLVADLHKRADDLEEALGTIDGYAWARHAQMEDEELARTILKKHPATRRK